MASLPLLFDTLVSVTVLLATITTRPRIATATEFTVGDDDGWATGVNYLTWSEKHNFTVGDVLVFKYVRGQHDVFQVTEKTFRSCNSSSGVLRTYAAGDDSVALAEAKSYWFICNISGHCLGGMRFGINVTSAGDGGVAEPPSSVLGEPPPSPMPEKGGAAAAAAGGGGGGLSWWWAIGLSMGLIIDGVHKC